MKPLPPAEPPGMIHLLLADGTFVPPDNTVEDTGPEIYNITASPSDFIYIVAWSDDAVAQGAIASFMDNTTGTTVSPRH
jgi:hypothetical protein